MNYTTFMIIVILIQISAIRICKLIDLKDRENTNTLVYVIGYVMGCIIVFTGYQLNIF